MPPYSTLRTFITSLQTGRTNITESLERLMSDHGALKQHPHFQDLRQGGAADSPMPVWARAALRASGMSKDEVDHIDRWPDPQKDAVRGALVTAVDGARAVHFLWELYDGNDAETEVRDPDASGGITIIFRSPRSGVQLTPSIGWVHVEV